MKTKKLAILALGLLAHASAAAPTTAAPTTAAPTTAAPTTAATSGTAANDAGPDPALSPTTPDDERGDDDVAVTSPWAIPRAGAKDGVFAAAQLFVGGDATVAGTDADAVLPSFRLDRAELGGGGRAGILGGLLRLEAIRSATPQSAFGIDGNSLLPRLKLGYGSARPSFVLGPVDIVVEARVGLVPEPWLETLERRLAARGLLPLPSERAALLTPADLGASVAVVIADDLLDLRVAVTNGEGLNEIELNAGKNIAAVVGTTPLRLDVGGPLSVGAQLGGRFGGVGIADVADHRVHAALFATHPRVHVVVEGSAGFGQDARADLRPVAVGGIVDLAAIPGWLGVSARLDARTADAGVADAWRQDALLAVFTDLGLTSGSSLRRARLWLAIEGTVAGSNAGPVAGVPAAAEVLRGLVALELTGLTDVFDPRPSSAR